MLNNFKMYIHIPMVRYFSSPGYSLSVFMYSFLDDIVIPKLDLLLKERISPGGAGLLKERICFKRSKFFS